MNRLQFFNTALACASVFAALLTAMCWSLSSVFASRAAQVFGGPGANRRRVTMAAIILSLWMIPHHPQQAGIWIWWFVFSGMIGLGVGDLCIFASYERLGARLPALIVHTLAVPLAGMIEWLWLGNGMGNTEIALTVLILVGVALALSPGVRIINAEKSSVVDASFHAGILFSICTAVCLAISAVMSRHANALAAIDGVQVDGWSAAGLRCIGAVVIVHAVMPLEHIANLRCRVPADARMRRTGWGWLAPSALMGPVLGLACYQWALAYGKAGPVQAVVAVTPILVMPLAYWLDGDRPTWRAVVGGIVAVTGAALMAVVSHA